MGSDITMVLVAMAYHAKVPKDGGISKPVPLSAWVGVPRDTPHLCVLLLPL